MSLSVTSFYLNDQSLFLMKLAPWVRGLNSKSGQGLPFLSIGCDLVSGPCRGLAKQLFSSYTLRYALSGPKNLVISL